MSARGRHVLVLVAAVATLAAADRADAALPADTTAVISGTSDLLGTFPTPVGSANVGRQSVSADGGRVAFTSTSDGLLAGDDDTVSNVYVRESATGTLTLVSRATGVDGEPSHADCTSAAISADGTRVAFSCEGALDPADTNKDPDVYVRDLQTGQTVLVSRAAGLGPVGNRDSLKPSIDRNGTHVAFESRATNLSEGEVVPGGSYRIYWRSIGAGDPTLLISRATGPVGAVPPGSAENASISLDGGRVAFDTPDAMDPADTNGTFDAYVRDIRAAPTTILVSRVDGGGGAVGNGSSERPLISGDGAFVAFTSTSTNFDDVHDPTKEPDVYRRSLAASATQLIDVTAAGEKANASASLGGIDQTGDRVAFLTGATNLSPSDAGAGIDAYVRSAGSIVLASRGDGGGPPANSAAGAALSGDGSRVAMPVDGATVPGYEPSAGAVVLRDLVAGTTRTVSRPPGDAPFVNAGGKSFGGSVSADGRFVAFTSTAPALGFLPGAFTEVFVRDTVTGTVRMVSRVDAADGTIRRGEAFDPRISADGRRVAFTFEADGPSHIFVRDLATDRLLPVDRGEGPDGPTANGSSSAPSISDDGTRVAFITEATNLGDGDTDAQEDEHVRDLSTGSTILASRADGAAGAKANNETRNAEISGDGRGVAFETAATNLGDGDDDAATDIHVRRLDAGRTVLASVGTQPKSQRGDSELPSISRDGNRVAFTSQAPGLVSPPVASGLYVRDIATGTLTLASRQPGGAGAPFPGQMGPGKLSADGASVAFAARPGTAVLPGVPLDGTTRVFQRDLATNATRLISRRTGPDGLIPADGRDSTLEGITADGGCVAFSSRADLLGPPAGTDTSQVYLRAVRADCGTGSGPAGPGDGPNGPGDGPGGGPPPPKDRVAPRLSSAKLSRTRFRVGSKRTALSARVRSGATLSVKVSEAAQLTVTVDRERPGRRSTAKGHRCIRVSHKPDKHACIAYMHDATLRRTVKRAGTTRVAITGRLGHTRLAVGRHRLTLQARDAAGNRSRTVTLRVEVVR